MNHVMDTFLSNITLIIAYMYIANKLKEFIILKTKKWLKLLWLTAIISSLLSIWVMHYPLQAAGMRIDLRAIPIFFTSFLFGWKNGLITILLPAWLRYEMGGPTVIQGIIQSILLPFLIGSLFHRKKAVNPPFTMVHFNHMGAAFLIYELIKSISMLWTTPATGATILFMCIFETIALLTIGLINNDVNRNLLTIKELEYQSRHDYMTNLYNLRHFHSKVEDIIRKKIPFVIALFDVDYFKNYNDTHGHLAGDTVLRTVGQLLMDSMREEDVFARYGGEEFIVCFTNVTNVRQAAEIAERFRCLVETYPFQGEEQQPNGSLTISMGLSTVSNHKSLRTLIEEADHALYLAKKAGRNTFKIYPDQD
ncbi:diguanylate cyclase [Neobacillus muris]|uniref:diguanylate cyclase n=1 Tax=Neobacillus muris TaxID=2941334 RepID=UPI00203FF832|nr:diguanylate cyclase [Neobacillus muris]